MPTNPFDKACRFLSRADPVGMIAWLLILSIYAFRFRRWIDTRNLPFPGEADRIRDRVAFLEEVAAHGRPWATVLEFQLDPDAEMFGRLLEYLGSVWRAEKPSPERGDRFELGAILVNLRGRGNTSRTMQFAGTEMKTILGVREVNLSELHAEETLRQIESGTIARVVLPFLPLMQGGAEDDIIQRWIRCAETEPNERFRGDLGALVQIFAEAAKCRDPWKQALKGWNMIVSETVQEWQAEALERGRGEGKIEGKMEGKMEGKIEGRVEGELTSKQASIGNILRARFRQTPVELTSQLKSLQDSQLLDELVILAATAVDLSAFLSEFNNRT